MSVTARSRTALISDLPPVCDSALPERLRLVGRVIAWDSSTLVALLEDQERYLLVDLSTPLGVGRSFAPRLKDLVMVTGELVANEPAVLMPEVTVMSTASGRTDQILRAWMIRSCDELDLIGWRAAVLATSPPA